MGYVLFAVGVAAALFALDQLALWAERRGWMYWRRSEGHRDAGGAVLRAAPAVGSATAAGR